MPIRRDFLVSVGAAVTLAGCSAQQETESNSPSNESVGTEPDTTNETEEESPEPDPTNETEEESPEPETGLELSVDSAEWFEEGYVAEFILANQGNDPIHQLELIVDWYDEEERFVGWDSERVPVLGTGKSWFAHVESSRDEAADSFEMFARGIPQSREIPDTFEIQSTEVVESVPEVTGVISNTQSSEVGANVVATVYNNGWLTHVGRTTQSRIPSGANWRFHAPITVVDADESSIGEEIELFVRQL